MTALPPGFSRPPREGASWWHGRRATLTAELLLAGAMLWFAFHPPATPLQFTLCSAVVCGVLGRLPVAWYDWRLAPVRLNRVWHRAGREKGRRMIDRVARFYNLEEPEQVPLFAGELGDALLHARQDLPARLGRSAPLAAIDTIAETVHAFWIPVDRSGTLASPGLRMQVLDPIPSADRFGEDFDTICLDRAQAILREDREIALFWSGGIDSTAALSALLMLAEPADRARLRIFLRPRSIDEYPSFFERHVRPLSHHLITGPRADRFAHGPGRTFSSDVGRELALQARDRLIVTGEHGDQIFGSIKLAENPEWIGAPAERFLEQPAFAPHCDAIARLNAACPVPVDTVDTLLWWWNFAVKWQEITFRGLSDLDSPAAFANVRHFFQTEDFQRWSIANPDLKIRDSLASYKWPAKDFIYRFTGDADYRDHKIKIGSLRVRIGGLLAVDNRFNAIRAGQTSTSDEKLRARYGYRLQRYLSEGPSP